MKNILIPILAFALTLGACEDVIEVELQNEASRIAIEAFIEDLSSPQVVVSRTKAYNDQTRTERVTNAVVRIQDNSVPPRSALLVAQDGAYTTATPFLGEVGKVYTLSVEVDGRTYTASDSLKRNSPLDSIKVTRNFDTDKHYSVFIFAPEQAGMGDNYRWVVYLDDQPLLHPSFLAMAQDVLVDGSYIDRAQILNGQFAAFVMGTKIVDGSRVRVRQMSISQAYYRYLVQLQQVSQGQGLFSPPPANVPTNFDNGAVGFFRASSVAESADVVAPLN